MGVLDDDSPVAVHFGVAGNYEPIDGKTNILFTMWESEWQGEDEVLPVIEAFRPPLVVTPCDWNTRMLRRLAPWQAVETVPLGYDPGLMRYTRRRWRPRAGRFRVLYLGAPNYRKYTVTREVYTALRWMRPKLLAKGIDLEWYWKVTGAASEYAVEELSQTGQMETLEKDLYRGDDWVVDNRFLDRHQVADLYHSAHLFLALHGGEGFGLNAFEAMATGCPLVVTDHSGTTQFATSRNASLVGWDDCAIKVHGPEGPMDQRVILPRLPEALDAVVRVVSDYYAATERAKRARSDIEAMTWSASARRLYYLAENVGSLGTDRAAAVAV